MKPAAANNELLQSRLDAGLSSLVDEANRGEPIWWKQSAWIWGLPTWSRSGRPFRGLAALLLWRAAAGARVPVAWQEAENQEDPAAIVIPVRAKRGFRPVAVVPAQRFGALPFVVPKWDEPQIERALAALKLHDCPALVPMGTHIRELTGAFVQALRRHAAPMGLRHSDWTIASLSVAAWIAATVADAAYAAQVGTVFSDEQVWERGDVAALFPWEAQEPGGPLEVSDRRLKREGARVLGNGKKPGQLPMRKGSVLRLDRVWERGDVLNGYASVLRFMSAMNIAIGGDIGLDTRKLGLTLSYRMARVEPLPEIISHEMAQKSWNSLCQQIVRKSWAHRLHVLHFSALLHDDRWDPIRTIPRVRRALSRIMALQQRPDLSRVKLSSVGLVRLLDAMGPTRPAQPPQTEEILEKIGAVSDRSYKRRPIQKADGTERWLDVPNPELAKAQRLIVDMLRPGAPFAGVATAFEPGRSPAFQARIHEGAIAAVIVDIADFFGSIRPRHLRWAFHPRPPKEPKKEAALTLAKQSGFQDRLLVQGGSREQREELISILFTNNEETQWLPQGAPSSPWAANLAAHPMDRRIRAWARDYSTGVVRYSRYADDLVVSLHAPSDGKPPPDDASIKTFLIDAEKSLRDAIQARGWTVKEEKTRHWRIDSRVPLTLCGIEVPRTPGTPCRLPRLEHKRARAALHHLRCNVVSDEKARNEFQGRLAWAWAATGHTGWLAWRNGLLSTFAIEFAGPILAEAFLAGWADSVDLDSLVEVV